MNFEIDESYLTNVTVVTYHNPYQNKDTLTHDELMEALKYQHNSIRSTSSDDHPEFKILRNKLEEQGYIKTQRSWWNGDTVLQSFTLNGVKFKKNEQFPCGAAIKYTVQSKRKNHG
jgi:hypothetical protein